MAKFLFSVLVFAVPSAWAFKDFKLSCGIPRTTPVSQRNYIENMILIKSLDGTARCWLAEFTLIDGAINKVTCLPLAVCPED